MSDLTDRMRTCAAHIVAIEIGPNLDGHVRSNLPVSVTRDAADLLIEASNIIEAATPQPEPMEVIQPVTLDDPKQGLGPYTESPEFRQQFDTWIAPGGPLPGLKHSGTTSQRPCPYCNSRSIKTVHRVENKLMLVCPVCAETWEFKR